MIDAQTETPSRANVILTTRDREVLRSLYDNTVMTFSQIATRHFANVAKPTVINRLSKLERAGFISRERIPRMELGRDKHAIGVVFQVTRLGILSLRQSADGRELRGQPIRIHHHSLSHDLILVDLSLALQRRFPGAIVTNGKLLALSGKAEALPDLVLERPCERGKVAIELELTAKSERRYQEIVLRYRMSKEYQQIIYFLDDPYIERLITRVIMNRNPHPKETCMTGKFYFSQANEFITKPETTTIANGGRDILAKGGDA